MIKLSFREKSASYCDHLGNCTPPLALAVISVGSFGLSVINYLSSLYNCINSKSWNERFRSGAYILPTAVPQLIVQISILSFFGYGLITCSIWAIIVIAKCLIWKSEVKWRNDLEHITKLVVEFLTSAFLIPLPISENIAEFQRQKNMMNYDKEREKKKLKISTKMAMKSHFFFALPMVIVVSLMYTGTLSTDSNNTITIKSILHVFLGICLPLLVLSFISCLLITCWSSRTFLQNIFFIGIMVASVLVTALVGSLCVPSSGVNRHLLLVISRDSLGVVVTKTEANETWNPQDEWIYTPENQTLFNLKQDLSFNSEGSPSLDFPNNMPASIGGEDTATVFLVGVDDFRKINWEIKPFR